jgi:hypothetical protein
MPLERNKFGEKRQIPYLKVKNHDRKTIKKTNEEQDSKAKKAERKQKRTIQYL